MKVGNGGGERPSRLWCWTPLPLMMMVGGVPVRREKTHRDQSRQDEGGLKDRTKKEKEMLDPTAVERRRGQDMGMKSRRE